jgi:hypothetical protein
MKQMFASFREHNLARSADKQTSAKLVFQLPDLHADRGLSHMDALRARRKRSGFGNRNECP